MAVALAQPPVARKASEDEDAAARRDDSQAKTVATPAAPKPVGSVGVGANGVSGGLAFNDNKLERGSLGASVNGMSAGLAFAPNTFETNLGYPIWSTPAYEVPIPAVPGLFAFIAPSVTIGTGTIENRKEGTQTIPASVAGNVSIGFSYGSQQVAALTGSLNTSATGAFEYKRGPGEARKLSGTLSLSSAFAIGCKVAGGLVNYNYEFGQVAPVATFAQLTWENGKFTKADFEWGPRVKEFFTILEQTIGRGKRLVQGGVDAARGATRAAVRTIRNAADFADDAWDKVTSW